MMMVSSFTPSRMGIIARVTVKLSGFGSSGPVAALAAGFS
jgi:hypothetical protein